MITSRAALDRALSERDAALSKASGLESANEILGDEIEWLRDQLKQRDETLLAMRREGFNPPPPADTAERAPVEQMPADVRSAIDAVADRGSALWGQLADYGRSMLASDVNPASVAQAIRRGGSFNPHH